MEVKRVKPQLKKNLWKPEEDLILKNYVETHGEGNWATVSKRSGLMRGGKSCRLRWKNYLRPNIKRGEMSKEEEDLIVRMHKLLGNRWSLIAGRLPGRTDNEVKNYWNTHLNKKSLIIGKRKTTEPDHKQGEDNDDENENVNMNREIKKSRPWCTIHSEPSGSAICLTRTRSQSLGLDHERNNMINKEEKDQVESTVTNPWINIIEDPNSFNCEIEYPMLTGNSNNNARLVFDDEPLIAYLDSFILFEAFGCDGESGGK